MAPVLLDGKLSRLNWLARRKGRTPQWPPFFAARKSFRPASYARAVLRKVALTAEVPSCRRFQPVKRRIRRPVRAQAQRSCSPKRLGLWRSTAAQVGFVSLALPSTWLSAKNVRMVFQPSVAD